MIGRSGGEGIKPQLNAITISGTRQGLAIFNCGNKYPNDLARKIVMRRRLRKNSGDAGRYESERGMAREQARLLARFHKLEAYREILLADVSACRVGIHQQS